MTRPRSPDCTVVFLVLSAVAAMTSRPARAVSPVAEALFQEGRRLLAAGNIEEACARFAASYSAEASSGTLLNLALCHETQGKIATAWAEYRGAGRLARIQNRQDRADVADDKAAALEVRLPRLTSVPMKPLPGLKIATENGTLGEGGAGVAIPVDPGQRKVIVSAPGYRPWATTVNMKEGELLTLEIPDLEAESLPTKMPVVDARRPIVTGDTATPGRSRLDLYLASGGGLLLIGGTAMWAIAYSKFQAAKTSCSTIAGCSEMDRNNRVSTITTLQTIAVGSWIAGGALLVATGVHRWIVSQRGTASATDLTLGIDVTGAGRGELSVHGVF